ncbi:MAG: NAD(P)/FAD-dependent oxidoreductase [Candidatus Diapherotrites archaeon]|nr:NAD(P)/FAD-dependent oxidoreductase [Candidatus Diapherotrites archaeon]
MYNVCVIGGGPVGLTIARNLNEKGWKCIVIEEHAKIGEPEKCSGLISLTGAAELGLNLNEFKLNEIYGADIYSPSGNKLSIEKQFPVANVIDRAQFDKSIAKQAYDSGVDFKTNTRLLSLNGKSVFLQNQGRGELIKADIIVGADGALSKTRDIMFPEFKEKKFVHGIQAEGKGNFNEKKVEVFFGNYAKNFFAWNIPLNKETSRIGLATSLGEKVKENFEEFVMKKNFNKESFENELSALIPCGAPIENCVKDNVLLAGDAAFQTKSTTGGGVILGIESAKACSDSIDAFLKYKKPLKEYNKRLEPVKKELRMHYKMRKYFNSLKEKEIDDLFIKLKKAGIEEFLSKEGDMDKPSKFIPKLAGKPKLWLMFGTAIKFIMS